MNYLKFRGFAGSQGSGDRSTILKSLRGINEPAAIELEGVSNTLSDEEFAMRASDIICEAAEMIAAYHNGGEIEAAYALTSEAVGVQGTEAPSEAGVWTILVWESGFARGTVMTDDPKLGALPHYFPKQVVAQVADACRNARFGRRHPVADGEEADPSRIAGWLEGGRMQGSAAFATMHLFEGETELQAKLTGAAKARKLDLFGASILAYFAWQPGKAEGRDALVAQRLGRLVSVDMVTEAGAGGKILPYAPAQSVAANPEVSNAVAIMSQVSDVICETVDRRLAEAAVLRAQCAVAALRAALAVSASVAR